MDGREELLYLAWQQLKSQDNTVLDSDKTLCHTGAQSQLIAPALKNPVQREQREASQSPLSYLLLHLGEKAASTFPNRQEPVVKSGCHISLRILTSAVPLGEALILNCRATATQSFNLDPIPGVPISPQPFTDAVGSIDY